MKNPPIYFLQDVMCEICFWIHGGKKLASDKIKQLDILTSKYFFYNLGLSLNDYRSNYKINSLKLKTYLCEVLQVNTSGVSVLLSQMVLHGPEWEEENAALFTSNAKVGFMLQQKCFQRVLLTFTRPQEWSLYVV